MHSRTICANKREESVAGQVRRCCPRPPTVRFASIAGITPRCREPPLGAPCGSTFGP
jgi:hypothetical protein